MDAIWLILDSGVTCPTLTAPLDGLLSYDPDMSPPYQFGTTVTYSCNGQFGLSSGDMTRECVLSDTGGGRWTGTAPTCGSEFILFCFIVV